MDASTVQDKLSGSRRWQRIATVLDHGTRKVKQTQKVSWRVMFGGLPRSPIARFRASALPHASREFTRAKLRIRQRDHFMQSAMHSIQYPRHTFWQLRLACGSGRLDAQGQHAEIASHEPPHPTVSSASP